MHTLIQWKRFLNQRKKDRIDKHIIISNCQTYKMNQQRKQQKLFITTFISKFNIFNSVVSENANSDARTVQGIESE